MLNWLKRKASNITFHSRSSNIFKRVNPSKMFLTEQSIIDQEPSRSESIKIFIYNEEGDEYSLDVPFEMTLNQVKGMAVGHFFTPFHSVASDDNQTEGSSSYSLVLVRDLRTLPDDLSVLSEKLVDYDEILLVQKRKCTALPFDLTPDDWETSDDKFLPATLDNIIKFGADIESKNDNRQAHPVNPALDFKLALRRILLTMIVASVHLISPEENSPDTFAHVFEQLEKRHKPKVDKNALRQLVEMGFSEHSAAKALQIKKTVPEAAEWLLEKNNSKSSQEDNVSILLALPSELRRDYFFADRNPAEVILKELDSYINRWFKPDAGALHHLMLQNYGADLAKEALRSACNNEIAARALLEGNDTLAKLAHEGFDRESPVMEAILGSPTVQVALAKPKTLYALMILCENPSNANMWLSDPETHPVVSQVLRIYHAEKHKLWSESSSLGMPVAAQSAAASTVSSSHTGPSDIFLNMNGMGVTASFTVGHGSGTISGMTGSPLSALNSGATRPIPVTMRIRSEPMSHSGSPTAGGDLPPELGQSTLTFLPPTVEGGAFRLSVRLANRGNAVEPRAPSEENDEQNMDTS